MSGSRPTPTDIVLTQLDDEADSFKYISNVINPSFLYLELLDGSVKIQGLVGRFTEETDERFGQLLKPVLFAAPSASCQVVDVVHFSESFYLCSSPLVIPTSSASACRSCCIKLLRLLVHHLAACLSFLRRFFIFQVHVIN